MKLRLCVIGCGGFARTFAESLKGARDQVDLYFASRDHSRANAYSDEFGGLGAFGAYEDAAASSDVDALYICTPHDLHLEHSLLATEAKKHILLEKPIARTVDEAQSIISAADNAGVKLMVAENYRFLATVVEAKKLIDAGTVGRVRLIQLQEEYPFYPNSWRNDQERNGGGVMIDGGIHKASVLAYLSGRPNQVYAVRVPPGNPDFDVEDGMVITTSSAQGAVGIINHTWSIGKSTERPWVSVTGTLANLYFEMGRPWLKIDHWDTQETMNLEADHRGIPAMVAEFARCISEETEPSMAGGEGLQDLALVLKAYESAESGLPEKLG